jgi:hypothetical protein
MTAETWNSGKREVAIAMQQHSEHVSAAMNQHATTEELPEVFSVWSTPKLYSKDEQEKLVRRSESAVSVVSCK